MLFAILKRVGVHVVTGGARCSLLVWLMLGRLQVGKEETFMDSIKTEIAIMKKVHHPNVLRLYEVMDDPKVRQGGWLNPSVRRGVYGRRVGDGRMLQ